jgi:TRAP transporter TAXI family solute receptor
MKKKVVIMIGLFVALLISSNMPNLSFAASQTPKAVSLGTSSIGSTFYVIAVGMADIISKHSGISATAQSVGGSDANMRAIKMGKVHLAMANSFSSGNAFLGTRQFVKMGPIPIRLIALGQPSLRQTVARADSGIKSISDLKGKKFIAKRKSLAELELVADAMLKVKGIKKKDVRYISTAKTKEAIDALVNGTVHAAILPGGVPASTIMKLFEKIDARYLDISSNELDGILKELGPAFHKKVVRAGIYKGHNKDALAPSLSATMVVSEDLSEESVYRITKALFDNYADLKLVHKAAKHWNVNNSLKSFHIPFHAGAIKYFKEIGAWKPRHEKRQAKLSSGR